MTPSDVFFLVVVLSFTVYVFVSMGRAFGIDAWRCETLTRFAEQHGFHLQNASREPALRAAQRAWLTRMRAAAPERVAQSGAQVFLHQGHLVLAERVRRGKLPDAGEMLERLRNLSDMLQHQ